MMLTSRNQVCKVLVIIRYIFVGNLYIEIIGIIASPPQVLNPKNSNNEFIT